MALSAVAAIPEVPSERHVHDVLDRVLGEDAQRLHALRSERTDARTFAQKSYDALLAPAAPGGLSPIARHLVALRVATLNGQEELAGHYRAALGELGLDPEQIEAGDGLIEDARLPEGLRALLVHADLLTLSPGAAGREHIAALEAKGFTAAEIVTASQLIAFVNFQARLLAGVAALSEAP
jgi:CMD domain protein